MLIGVLSDTHDNILNTRKAIKILNNNEVKVTFHCGDFVSPFTLKEFYSLSSKLIGVFGNNDGDKCLLSKIAKKRGFELYEGFYSLELENRRILVLHGFGSKEKTKNLVYSLAKSGNYDVILYGHTHEFEKKMFNNTLIVNPGEVFGLLSGKASLAVVNLKTLDVNIIEINVKRNNI